MSRIIVAGAGHGGLAAAAMLAEAGHSVTVYEQQKEEGLGHDWQDRFTFSVLADVLGTDEAGLPDDIWEYRGDCAFVSPAKRKRVVIRYTDETRQKIMWRKPILKLLVQNARDKGVRFCFETEVTGPVVSGNTVTGITTNDGETGADLVIDAAGIFSPVRSKLPKFMQIERSPARGDVFYAYRAYYDLAFAISQEAPFEVYLRHEGEQGLSWFYTAKNHADVLIGRTEPLTSQKVDEQLAIFKNDHPWLGETLLHGGQFGVIPVRRPLTLMVANGYAAVGDSAFMTTPMNGMGLDLSLQAGALLAKTVLERKTEDFSARTLWAYNRNYHVLYGGDTAKNEGLKNALLNLPSHGVDFLFEQDVIQASDLSGAGRNTNIGALLGKFTRGMKQPPYFGAILNGLIKGAKAASLYKAPPEEYDLTDILRWDKQIKNCVIPVK